MTIGPAFLAVHGGLFLAFGVLLISALRTLRRLEFFAPAYGARRITFDFRSGSPFPCELLPPALRRKAETGTLFLLFSSPQCAWCDDILPGMESLARDYRHAGFLVLTDEPWQTRVLRPGTPVEVLVDSPITKRLGVTQQPFGMRIEQGRIVDFGIVNSMEHVESLL